MKTKEERNEALEKWLEGRPDSIKKLARTIGPWDRCRLKDTGQHGWIYSYFEDGTVAVRVDGHDNEARNIICKQLPIIVFGIPPEDLEVLEG